MLLQTFSLTHIVFLHLVSFPLNSGIKWEQITHILIKQNNSWKPSLVFETVCERYTLSVMKMFGQAN